MPLISPENPSGPKFTFNFSVNVMRLTKFFYVIKYTQFFKRVKLLRFGASLLSSNIVIVTIVTYVPIPEGRLRTE